MVTMADHSKWMGETENNRTIYFSGACSLFSCTHMSICACKHRALGPVHVSIHLYTRYPDTHMLKHTNFFEYYTHSFPQREIWSYPNLHLIYIYPSDITTHTHTHTHTNFKRIFLSCSCFITASRQNIMTFCFGTVRFSHRTRQYLQIYIMR